MFKVATLIVTRNGEKWINSCLSCLRNSTVQTTVFVFDNNSKDNTTTILTSNADYLFHIEKNFENIGFGAANNRLLKKAFDLNFDYFFLINQDVYIQKNTLEILLNFLLLHSGTGVISPIHLNGSGNSLDKNFCSYISKNKSLLNDFFLYQPSDWYCLPFINAACWLLPRSTLSIAGGFDPLFFHYAEDDNYCHRLIFHNLKIVIHTKSFICHDRDQRSTQAITMFEQNRGLRKWITNLSNPLNNKEKKEAKYLLKELITNLFYFTVNLQLLKIVPAFRTFNTKKKILKKIIEHKEINKKQGLNWL